MKQSTNDTAQRTFRVSRVGPAKEILPEVDCYAGLSNYLGGPVESCSRYHGKLVAGVFSHPLIAAVHGAFCGHRPLRLSPDIIWLTITQGLSKHINQNAEQLRSQLVSHDGQLTLKVRRDEFVKGSPENPWSDVFGEFSEQIRTHSANAYELVVADFSTTGPVERAASEVALMDSMKSYFRYEFATLCGIPSIILDGTEDDWSSIRRRIEGFSGFGLEWWCQHLRPILKEFEDAARGKIRRSFWDSIYKYQGPKGSGSPYLTGWLVDLFPYLSHSDSQPNPWLGGRQKRKGPSRSDFCHQVSCVPFTWQYFDTVHDMEFVAGLLGVSQDHETFALTPEIGWAVREARSAQGSPDSMWPNMPIEWVTDAL